MLLRSTDDLKVWKIVLAGIVLCDVLHLWGSLEVLGSQGFWDVRKWRWEEWVSLGMLWGPGAMRVMFCAGVGLGEEERDGKMQKKK